MAWYLNTRWWHHIAVISEMIIKIWAMDREYIDPNSRLGVFRQQFWHIRTRSGSSDQSQSDCLLHLTLVVTCVPVNHIQHQIPRYTYIKHEFPLKVEWARLGVDNVKPKVSLSVFHHVLHGSPAFGPSCTEFVYPGCWKMVQQVRLMMFSLIMVDYSISFLSLYTWDFSVSPRPLGFGFLGLGL